MGLQRSAALAVVGLVSSGCSQGPGHARAREGGWRASSRKREKNGAISARRAELALARSELGVRERRSQSGGALPRAGSPGHRRPQRAGRPRREPAREVRRARLRRDPRRSRRRRLPRLGRRPPRTSPRPGTASTTTTKLPRRSRHGQRSHPRQPRQLHPRARRSRRLPRRRRLPRPRQRLRRHPRRGRQAAPNQPEDMDGWQDEDGCPDPDNDSDLGPRPRRRAPRTSPGRPGETGRGCPKKNQRVVVTANEIRITEQIKFSPSTRRRDRREEVVLDPRRGGAGAPRQPADRDPGPGAHRQRRRRRLQLEALAVARRRRPQIPHRARHPRHPAHRQGVRRHGSRSSRTRPEANRAINRRSQFIRTESRP